MKDEDLIQIKWKEYKELLVLKGKYEELKENRTCNPVYFPTITYDKNIKPDLSNPTVIL